MLFGLRNNAPARNFWFTAGGRIRKNEALGVAKVRIASEELGLPASVWERAILMGAWDHFYPDSAFDANISTHYVNLPHWVSISNEEKSGLHLPAGPTEQHARWQWIALADAERNEAIHPFARSNAQWVVKHLSGN